jgi:hypothetical protein
MRGRRGHPQSARACRAQAARFLPRAAPRVRHPPREVHGARGVLVVRARAAQRRGSLGAGLAGHKVLLEGAALGGQGRGRDMMCAGGEDLERVKRVERAAGCRPGVSSSPAPRPAPLTSGGYSSLPGGGEGARVKGARGRASAKVSAAGGGAFPPQHPTPCPGARAGPRTHVRAPGRDAAAAGEPQAGDLGGRRSGGLGGGAKHRGGPSRPRCLQFAGLGV